LVALKHGISFKCFSFYESFRKTRKFRACRGNHLAALKREANKKDIKKVALNFLFGIQFRVLMISLRSVASFLVSRQEMMSGLGRKPNC